MRLEPVRNWKIWLGRVKELRVTRGFVRYGTARGGVLAGGIAYSALFALTAAMTIAWTAFMALMGSDSRLRADVLRGFNRILPGILKTGDGGGVIDPDSLVLKSAVTPASVLAGLVLLFTATSVVANVGKSVQAMFGIVSLHIGLAARRLRSLGGFVVLVLGVGASSVLTVFGGLGALVSFVIDVGVVAFIFRVVAGVRMPRRDLLLGATSAAAGTTILRLCEKSLIGSVSDNALLASFTAVAALLLGLNLASRILLVCAAIAANPPTPYVPVTRDELHATQTPNYVTLSAPHTLDWLHNPLSGSVIPADADGVASADAGSGRRPDCRKPDQSPADELGGTEKP